MILGVDIQCFRDSWLWKQRVHSNGFCKVWRSYVMCHWVNSSKCFESVQGNIPGLLDPGDGGNMIHQNVWSHLPNDKASHLGTPESSW